MPPFFYVAYLMERDSFRDHVDCWFWQALSLVQTWWWWSVFFLFSFNHPGDKR
jgi:hypothetical protein